MEKKAVIVSILLILVGIILAANHNIRQKVDSSHVIDDQSNKWTVSGLFMEGERMGLYFVQPKDWSFGPYPDLGEPSYSKHLLINVTNVATGEYTLLRVVLAVPRTEIPPKPPYAFMLMIYNVEVKHDGGLITETHPKWTGQLIALGVAKSSGQYYIKTELVPNTVIDENGKPKLVSPPIQLVLYKVLTNYVTPYTFLLPTGLITILSGVSLLVYDFRRKSLRRKRKLKFSK